MSKAKVAVKLVEVEADSEEGPALRGFVAFSDRHRVGFIFTNVTIKVLKLFGVREVFS